MFTINTDKVKIIPLDFWAFYSDARYIGKNWYTKNRCVSETAFDFLCQELVNNKDDNYVAIDMSNISAYPTRLFSKLEDNLRHAFFFNITEESVRARMKEDLSKQLAWPEETVAMYSDDDWEMVKRLVSEQCLNYRKQRQAEILKDIMMTREKQSYPLESSGLYSNCYLSAKKLFREVDAFYYIIYSLAQRLSELRNFDALVTSSKNGAIIATVLGDLLNVKEVHLIGIGPKYTMKADHSIDRIKAGKRYVYVFDFMCTGTELKIVSALIHSKKGIIKGAVGISRYKEDIGFSIDGDINVLIERKDLGIKYIISGEEEDLIMKDGK